MYITVPIPSRSDESDIPPFEISVNEQTCAKEPFAFRLVSPDNRWTSILSLSLSDKDFECLKEQVLAADAKRQEIKRAALDALMAELEPQYRMPTPPAPF